jgi:hypothetical protein
MRPAARQDKRYESINAPRRESVASEVCICLFLQWTSGDGEAFVRRIAAELQPTDSPDRSIIRWLALCFPPTNTLSTATRMLQCPGVFVEILGWLHETNRGAYWLWNGEQLPSVNDPCLDGPALSISCLRVQFLAFWVLTERPSGLM